MWTIVGVIFLGCGIPFAIWPYKCARLNEQLDAIGSKHPSYAVEPADWYVTFTRISGIVMVIIGGWALIFG